MSLILIYTRTDKWLISKEKADWKIWNNKLYWFMTSLTYENSNTLAEFLRNDFHLTEKSEKYIIDSLNDNNKTYEIEIDPNKDVKITPIQVDLLNSKGEVIDWQDWSYFFTKVDNKYELWVYVGGVADICREISLSADQIDKWKEKGNPFIKEIAADLQRLDSKIYADAVNDNRKLL
jgi:hypothetical protein